jgi:hypothetical protein
MAPLSIRLRMICCVACMLALPAPAAIARQQVQQHRTNPQPGPHRGAAAKSKPHYAKLDPDQDFIIIAKIPGKPAYARALKAAFKNQKISMGCIGSHTYSVYAYRKDKKRADAIILQTARKQGYRPEIY